MKLLSIFLNNIATRLETFEGRQHLVVPVVALVEGVHHGSGGPVYYPMEEIAKSVPAWNGVPITIDHPVGSNKNIVSANSPGILEEWGVGRFWNVEVFGNRLKGEAWIDIEKAKQLRPEILAEIHNNLEVSTGLWSDEDGVPGTWNGETHSGTLSNFRPDHLALLPDKEGACNWQDGCGVRINMKGGDNLKKINVEDEVIKAAGIEGDGEIGLFRKLLNSFVSRFKSNEMSHDEVRQQLRVIVDSLDTAPIQTGPNLHYIHEVFDDYFIIRQENATGQTKLFKQGFKVVDEKVELEGDKVEVIEQTTFVDAGSQATYNEVNSKKEEENIMGDKCCKELINELISNESTQYVEDDRKWLEEMPEDQLKKMVPVVNESDDENQSDETTGSDSEEANEADDQANLETEIKEPVTAEKYIADAPPEIREMLTASLNDRKARQAAIIKDLLANTRNKFTKEQLEAKGLEELTAIAELANVPVDFSVNSAAAIDTEEDENIIPPPPVINWKKAAGISE